MIDINTILTQALTAAVAEATKPLVERIAALEAQLAAQATLEALEAQATPAPQDEATKPLAERIAALEKHTAVLDQHGGILEYLDNQEWFWEKVRRFADAAAHDSITHHEDNVYHYDKGAVETLIEDALDAHLENANHPDDDDIETAIDSAIERHEENRTHGDEDDIEEIVQRLLNSASISITV